MRVKLESSSLTGDDLECIVTDMAAQAAENANKQGVKEQLFLLAQLGYDETYIWTLLLREHLTEGTEVVVSDPKAEDSAHSTGFAGVVDKLLDERVTVIDCLGDAFDVDFDEIESFENNFKVSGTQ